MILYSKPALCKKQMGNEEQSFTDTWRTISDTKCLLDLMVSPEFADMFDCFLATLR